MTRNTHKSLALSGITILAMTLAACGGGGSSTTTTGATTNSTITGGVANCAAVGTPETVSGAPAGSALIGSCEIYNASTSPVSSVTAFRNPGTASPVVASTTGYSVDTPLVTGGSISVPLTSELKLAGGLQAASLGDYAGRTFQVILNASNGGAATVYDYQNTNGKDGSKFMNLVYSRFGLFSRFEDRYLGYYGGWIKGDSTATALPTGVVTFNGAMVGVIGPATTAPTGKIAGLSSKVSITVDFSATPAKVTSIGLTTYGYSQNAVSVSGSPGISAVAEGAAAPSVSAISGNDLSATFAIPATTSGSAVNTAILSGKFFGSGATASELVGTLRFTTADGRNGIGSFGVKSGALLTP